MKKKIWILSLLLLIIPIQTFAFFRDFNKIKVNGKIAEPIVRVEKLEETEIIDFKKDTTKEYKFKIKNYYLDNSKNERINEVDLIYNLKIEFDNSFPIKAELYDEEGNDILNGKRMSDDINLAKNQKQEKEYTLVVSWENKENMSSSTDVFVQLIANQIK